MKKLLFSIGIFMGNLLSAEPSNTNESYHTRQMSVENGLRHKIFVLGEPKVKANIFERMNFYKVSGISLAVVNDHKMEWARGYGHITNDPKSAPINEHTLFQAGSISKPITAFGALLLVQQGKISLDEDVNVYLKRWKVPENEFTKTEKVTLRRLLSHTAGLSIDGFSGYSTQASIPSIVEILQGKKPIVNTGPVIVVSKPGTEMKYSGGGTTIVQLLIEEITGEPFDIWMQKNVLNPLGMVESTFTQPLPPAYARIAAYGHHLNGLTVEGNWHIYPEMAAAGLWSTPKDLAQFILYIQEALKGKNTILLNSHYVKEMITRQKIDAKEIDAGLGLFLENYGEDLVFYHGGQDEGFISRLSGYAYRGQGLVIMMNNDSGWNLMDEIINSIADTYGWPHFAPIEKKLVSIDPASFSHFYGKYVNKETTLDVSNAGGKLSIDFNNGVGPMGLLPSGKCQFFMREADVTVEFLNCEEEKADRLILTDSKNTKTTYQRSIKE